MKRHFDSDALLQTSEVFHFDESNGDFAIETTMDVEPFLDANKRAQNNGTNGYTPSRDMKHIASIPLVIIEKWRNDHGVDIFNRDHQQKIRQLLNDPDWRYLRTSGGRY